MYDSGQVKGLIQYKDGKPDGLVTAWRENGQKQAEETFKDGEEVSAKYWNSKGEEVETEDESRK
jgi:antitoxin component YwqK of YwqJK toxin-antitoxin module